MTRNPLAFFLIAASLSVAGCATSSTQAATSDLVPGASSIAGSAATARQAQTAPKPASTSAARPRTDSAPANQMPMYGGQALTDKQKQANDAFIQKAESFKGGRKAAFETTLKLGWAYLYEKRDPVTAMKRFNQAWLLDPEHDEVYFAFGFMASMRGNVEEAIQFYKRCLAINPNHPIALANLARSYKDQAYQIYAQKQSALPNQDVKDRLIGSLALYEKASRVAGSDGNLRLTTPEEDLSYIYYQWAVALEFSGKYAEAWEKIKLTRQHGGARLIEPGFIQELSGFMPEPPDA